MSVTVHQVEYTGSTNGQVYPITDRRIIDFLTRSNSGVVTGCEITNPSGNTLDIATGWGVASGCAFTIVSESVSAEVATSGTQIGELILVIDTTSSTAALETRVGNSLSVLTQDDLTASDGVYEMRLATYDIDTVGTITNLTETYDTITPGDTLPFEFGIDSNGNYGYIKVGESTVTPFDPWDIVVPVGYALTSNNGTPAISGGTVSTSAAYGCYIIVNTK